MPDTLLASLASTLKPSILEVARSLGEPEQAISRGFELAVAAVFEELTGKTDDLEMLRQVIDLASNPPNLGSTAVSTGQLTNSNSALIAGGKRLLSILFGNREQDWSIEINGLRYLHVSTTILEELVQCALIIAAMSLSEGAARPPQ
jgi:hypothetical protein